MSLHSARFAVPAALDSIAPLREAVEARALAATLDEVGASLFAIACVEAFTNILRHAGLGPAETSIEVAIEVLGDRIEVDLMHTGQPYEPPSQLPEMRLEDYPEGGFGLRIIRAASDEVRYLRGDAVNIVRLTKRLPRRTH